MLPYAGVLGDEMKPYCSLLARHTRGMKLRQRDEIDRVWAGQ